MLIQLIRNIIIKIGKIYKRETNQIACMELIMDYIWENKFKLKINNSQINRINFNSQY